MFYRFEAQELKINSLKARIKLLEDKDRRVADQSRDDALIKGRRLDEEEKAAERVMVPTAAEVATATVTIPTSSGVVSTASPIIPTAAPIFTTATESTPYTRRKGKEKMVESDTTKKKKLREQIDFQQRKPLTRKYQREFYTLVLRNQAGWKAKHFKEMTLEEIKEKFDPVWKQIQDFIPLGSKEEAERLKRKGLKLEQESAKKLKTSEEVPEEVKSSKEVPEEKVKEMMQLVPVEEIYVEALQVKHLIIDWKRGFESVMEISKGISQHQNLMHALVEWKLYDTCGVHHVTSKDKEIFMLVEKYYPFRKGLAIVMICYKLQLEHQVYGRIVRNKMHKAFPLPVIEFPLSEEVPTISEESSHCQKKSDATVKKIALLVKSRNNYHIHQRNIKNRLVVRLGFSAARQAEVFPSSRYEPAGWLSSHLAG
nr:hypothetical protein [Tanacetum cinerariifolium]